MRGAQQVARHRRHPRASERLRVIGTVGSQYQPMCDTLDQPRAATVQRPHDVGRRRHAERQPAQLEHGKQSSVDGQRRAVSMTARQSIADV